MAREVEDLSKFFLVQTSKTKYIYVSQSDSRGVKYTPCKRFYSWFSSRMTYRTLSTTKTDPEKEATIKALNNGCFPQCPQNELKYTYKYRD